MVPLLGRPDQAIAVSESVSRRKPEPLRGRNTVGNGYNGCVGCLALGIVLLVTSQIVAAYPASIIVIAAFWCFMFYAFSQRR